MKVFIAGCGGFTGYSVARRLLSEGKTVIGVDNFAADYGTGVIHKRIDELKMYKNFTFFEKDVCDNDLQEVLKGSSVDYFINLAKTDNYYTYNSSLLYSDYVKTNVYGSVKMFELAVSLKAKKYIGASALGVYGDSRKKLLTEKNIVPKPVSEGSASFYADEQSLQYLSNLHSLPTFVFRFATKYGPMMRPHTVIPHFIDRLDRGLPFGMYSDIHTSRDFVFIDDVVNYIVSSFNKRVKYQVVNIASGELNSLLDVANKIAKIMGKTEKDVLVKVSEKYKFDKDFKWAKADISRAIKLLNYTPQVDIDSGLRTTVEWYLNHKDILRVSAP